MTNEVATTGGNNPFAGLRHQHINAGTVDIEQSRAVAEAQGKLLIAKRFPRDAAAAFDKVMASCSRPSLAAQATYSYPKGGQTISGPSIRLAEELARAWGNLDFGIRELSQRDGQSEMQAYAWDLETNVISTQNFSVKHERHTSSGVKRLTDPRDIYEMTANQAGRRLRARILAILPPDLVEAALDRCRATLVAAANPTDKKKVNGLLKAFERFGVTLSHIETRLGHSIEAITSEELADLIDIGNSLKDNMSSATDWFNIAQAPGTAPAAAAALNNNIQGAAAAQAQNPDSAMPQQPVDKTQPAPTSPGGTTRNTRKKQEPQPSQEPAPEAPAANGNDDELV